MTVPQRLVRESLRLPLSLAQREFWLLEALEPDHAGSHEQFSIRLSGPLDTERLAIAWRALLERHPVLCMAFGTVDGEVWQEPAMAGVSPIRHVGVRSAAEWQALIADEAVRRFDLAGGGLLRPVLARTSADEHRFLVTAHHLVADGLSVAVLMEELAALYGNSQVALPAAPRFTDRPVPAETDLERAVAWWAERLADSDPDHGLQRLAQAPRQPRRSRRLPLVVEPALAAALRRLARTERCTLFTVLLAAWRVLLLRYGSSHSLPISVPMTLRDGRAQTRMVGCLVHSLPLLTPCKPTMPFVELLRAERDGLLAALAHRQAAPGQIAARLRTSGADPRAGLSQLLFQFDAAPPPVVTDGLQWQLEPVVTDRHSWWELEWSLTDQGEGGALVGHVGYAEDMLDEALIAAMPAHWLSLLQAIVAAPETPVGQLPYMGEAERARILRDWNATAKPLPVASNLHAAVAAVLQAEPTRGLIDAAGVSLSASALAERIDALAAALAAVGVQPGDRVGLQLDPSVELIAALLAVLRAGAVVVPLDPAYPAARRAFMANDAGMQVVVTTATAVDVPAGLVRVDVDALPAPDSQAPLAVVIAPEAPAFLLYTSGSTGEPKGATLSHAAILNRCAWMWQAFPFSTADRFCLRTSLNFVDSLWEIFGALLHGATLVLLDAAVARDALRLVPALAAGRVTQLVGVPGLLRAVLDALPVGGLPALRLVISSGEPLPVDLWRRMRRELPAVRLLNTYGTTEIWDATCYDTSTLTGTPERIPIGRPIANMACFVLDADGQPVPVGVAGELHVAGIGVGEGYWQRPGLSTERYVVAPAALGAQRLYRTGDLARWRADGVLECLGRIDRQLKLRGQRIEPGEIEAVVRELAAVRDAAVVLREDTGVPRLVAYVGAAAVAIDVAALQRGLSARLPAALCPADIVVIDQLPRTPSGKLDALRLPAPVVPAPALPTRPADALERSLVALFTERLGCAAIGRDENFFDLGGDSLRAMSLLARINAKLDAALALPDIFAAPTVATLAERLRGRVPGPRLAAIPPAATAALSFAQERLWFLDQLDPGSAAYNIAWTIVMEGRPDAVLIDRALALVVARHPQLRTVYPAAAGQPTQRELPTDCIRLAVETIEQAQWAARRQALARLPFDLAQGPLLRATLLLDAAGVGELVLVIHHIVTDGVSNSILFRELAQACTALAADAQPAWPALPLRYVDFSAWQRDRDESEALRWWREQLRGAPTAPDWPTDHARPAEQRFAGAWLRRSISAAQAARWREFARAQGVTLYMLLLAALKGVALRTTGQSDLLIGTPIGARPAAGLEDVVGLFVNTLVLRTDLGGDPDVSAFLQRVRTTVVEALARSAVPFEQLVDRLGVERSLARAPVFQTMFNLVSVPAREQQAAGQRWQLGPLLDQGVSSFDLALTVGDFPDGLELIFEYDTALFAGDTVAALADSYLRWLDEALRAPATPLSRLALADPVRALSRGSRTNEPLVGSLPAAWRRVVEANPQSVALASASESLTYADAAQRVNRLAHWLRAQGCGRGERVALQFERGLDLLCALLAVLETGAAYVLLDTELPPARRAALLADIEPRLVLTGFPPAAELVALSAAPLDLAVDAGDTAYLVYTSGTTGEPKGVVITHGNLLATVAGWRESYALAADDVHLQMASSAFDVFTGDWSRALLTGARLVFCPRETLLDPPALHRLIEQQQVNVAEFVPAVVRPLLAWLDHTGKRLDGLRLLIVGSDSWQAVEYRALRAHCAPVTRIVNSYGVAEATIDSSWYEGEPESTRPLPIGRPFAQTTLCLLDERLELAPPGAIAELCIGGAGVAAGYWRRPALTAARFVERPGLGRLYRTGDRARQRATGEFELLGRCDNQVKLRGQRVELGEIESALMRQPGVAAAVADLRGPADEAQLFGWVVPAGAAELEPAALRSALLATLPVAIVPTAIGVVDALPLTPNGKVDRPALLRPTLSDGEQAAADPRDAREALLCELYAEVLGGGRPVGIHTNFFAAGGHSLLAARLLARVRETLEVELPLRLLFEQPTVAGLRAALPEPGVRRPALAASARPPRLPLSAPQQRLWFLDALEPGNPAYHLPLAWRLRGPLDVAALKSALAAVVARQESLRTVFRATAGEPEQVILAPAPVPLERADAGVDCAAFIARPFDLAQGPLWRALLVTEPPGSHLLVLVLHHIVADGWSLSVLARELSTAYGKACGNLETVRPPLAIQYADVALSQRVALDAGAWAPQRRYWIAQLQDAPAAIALPFDRPRPPLQTWQGAWHRLTVSPEVTTGLLAGARSQRATLFMVLLAAFQALLARWSGQEDIVVATPVAGRGEPKTEELIGFFLNTLALRTDLRGNPAFVDLVARVRRISLDAFAHAELPFEQVVEALQPVRSRAFAPLAQVLFVLHNQPRATAAFPGLAVEDVVFPGDHVKYELALHVAEQDGGLTLGFAWNTALFDVATVTALAEGYVAVLEAVVADSGQRLGELPVAGRRWLDERAAERARLRPIATPVKECDADAATLVSRIEAQVQARGAALAVDDGCHRWSYDELWARSGQVASAVLAASPTADIRPVALLLGHDATTVAALLGVLRAGRPYLPLDPLAPPARHQELLRVANATALVADAAQGVAEWLPQLPTVNIGPDDRAYLLPTSGTTGTPKLIAQTHGGVLGHVGAWGRQLGITAADRIALLAGFGTDAAVQDVFGALLHGASLHPLDLRSGTSAQAIVSRVAEQGITLLHLAPTVFRHLFGAGTTVPLPAVTRVVLGGEPARRSDFELFTRHFSRGTRLVNGLGLTESTTALQWFADHDSQLLGESLPVGEPVPGTGVSVIDGSGAPGHWCGQLVLDSDWLGHDPAEAPSTRLPTGDRLRRMPDGQWVFGGRGDRQLKLRGMRIEPGEIEAALRAVSGVSDAHVGLCEPSGGEPMLVAWVGSARGLDAATLRQQLRERLPEVLVPTRIIVMDELPRRAGGKLDVAALATAREQMPPGAMPEAPGDATVARLGALWAEVLQRPFVRPQDDFFALGGHSLLATRLIARVRDAFTVEVPLAAIFAAPTPEAFAAVLRQPADRPAPALPAIRVLPRT